MLDTETRTINSRLRFGSISVAEAEDMHRSQLIFRDLCDSYLQYVAGGFFNEATVSGYADFLLGIFREMLDGEAATSVDPAVMATLRSAMEMARSGDADADIAAFIVRHLGAGTDIEGGISLFCRMIFSRVRDNLVHPYIAVCRLWSAGLNLDWDYRNSIENGIRLAKEWENSPENRIRIEQDIALMAEKETWPSIRRPENP